MHPCLQLFLPKYMLSRFVGWLANCEITWLKTVLIKMFTKFYQINMAEAEIENPYVYKTFNKFFTRAIKTKLRPIAQENNAFISPVDGTIYQIGHIKNNQLMQAKRQYFTIQDLLGCPAMNNIFHNGSFINIYLSPLDYHRVHMPIAGKLLQMHYIPGKLFAVNNTTANYIPNLFAKNERVVSLFQTKFGTIAIVLVGAMLVGSIETAWAGIINPKHPKEPCSIDYVTSSLTAQDTIILDKGQEMGLFNMGSTVIVLFENGKIKWPVHLTANTKVLMGQKIGDLMV